MDFHSSADASGGSGCEEVAWTEASSGHPRPSWAVMDLAETLTWWGSLVTAKLMHLLN